MGPDPFAPNSLEEDVEQGLIEQVGVEITLQI